MRFITWLALTLALPLASESSLLEELEHALCFDACDTTDQAGHWDATLANGANCSRGAVALDGADDYVRLARDRRFGGAISLSVWTKWASSAAYWSMVVNFADENAENNIVLSRYSNQQSVRFGVRVGTTWEKAIGGTIVDDAWTHLVATADGNRTLRLYQDGALVGEETLGHAPPALNRTNHWLGRSDTGNYWAGALGSLHAWGRALDASEVSELHALGREHCVLLPTAAPTPAPSQLPSPAPTRTTVLRDYLVPPSTAQQAATFVSLRDAVSYDARVLKPNNATGTFYLMNNNPARGGGAGGGALWGEVRLAALELWQPDEGAAAAPDAAAAAAARANASLDVRVACLAAADGRCNCTGAKGCYALAGGETARFDVTLRTDRGGVGGGGLDAATYLLRLQLSGPRG